MTLAYLSYMQLVHPAYEEKAPEFTQFLAVKMVAMISVVLPFKMDNSVTRFTTTANALN